MYSKTREEAGRKLIAALKDTQEGVPVINERQQLSAYLEDWLTAVRPVPEGQQCAPLRARDTEPHRTLRSARYGLLSYRRSMCRRWKLRFWTEENLPTPLRRPEAAERLRALLDSVAAGEVSAAAATQELRDLPFADLGFARVDHHRELRQGACEIVYAPGKTAGEIEGIVTRLLESNVGPVLVTRADDAQRSVVRAAAARHGLSVDERPRAGGHRHHPQRAGPRRPRAGGHRGHVRSTGLG